MFFWEAGFWIPDKWTEKQQQPFLLKDMMKLKKTEF